MSDVKELPKVLNDGPLGVIDLPDDGDGGNVLQRPELRAERPGNLGSGGIPSDRTERGGKASGWRRKTWLLGGVALLVIAVAGGFVVSGALRGTVGTTPNRGLQPVQLANSWASGGGRANAPTTSQAAANQAPDAPTRAPATAAQDDTVELVATLGLKLQELGQRDQALAAQLVQADQGFQAQIAALTARVGQLEAADSAVVAAASKAASAPAAPVESARVVAPAPVHPTIDPSSYSIEAAAPGLAIVVRDGSAIQVGVGDMVPGVGKVTSIEPSGTGWTVHTTGGEIE